MVVVAGKLDKPGLTRYVMRAATEGVVREYVDMLGQVSLTTERYTRRIIVPHRFVAAMFHRLDPG